MQADYTDCKYMLRHNAIEAWETIQKSGGWKQCPPRREKAGSVKWLSEFNFLE